MLKRFIHEMIERCMITNDESQKLVLISDVLMCTNSSLDLGNKISFKDLQSILQECYKVRSSQSEILNNIGFNIKAERLSSMVQLKYSSNSIFVNKLEPFGNLLSVHGGHEFVTLKALITLIKENDTYVEIGANYGDFLISISEKVTSGGKVYGFEPSTTVFKYLQVSAEVSKYQNIVLENKAVSDKNGFVTFEITDSVEGFNSLGSAIQSERNSYHSDLKGVQQVRVQSVMLDDYFDNGNIIPSLIRLDIEGSECKALKGLRYTIEQYKPHLSVEFQSSLLKKYESHDSIKECLDILYDSNYDVRDLFAFESLTQSDIIHYYNENQDTELLCINNDQQLIEDLQNAIYDSGIWSNNMQATGDM